MYGVSVSNPTVVLDLQTQLVGRGYTRGGQDGKMGKYTCMEVLELQDDEGLGVDGIVGKQTATALKLKGTTKPASVEQTKDTINVCKNYDGWSIETIKQVQKALGIAADGKFGSQSCNEMINFQETNGIARYGRGILGSRTLSALGVLNPEKKAKSPALNNADFNPTVDCPKSSSCEIFEDLAAQKGYVKVNDRNNNTATGTTLFSYPIQSGKPGSESDTGLFKLGPVEYGSNNNPWKTSTLGSSDGEPNLYKFRRLMPASGTWGLEGIHGSRAYGIGKGSSGCSRVRSKDADVLAGLRSNTSVLISGIKPVIKSK
jgi:peptidoglycan hydrolase-like protein with peptidoglycan-binding domain